MKSSASESKPFQSRSKGEIPGRARREERLQIHLLNSMFLVRLMKMSAFEPDLISDSFRLK